MGCCPQMYKGAAMTGGQSIFFKEEDRAKDDIAQVFYRILKEELPLIHVINCPVKLFVWT